MGLQFACGRSTNLYEYWGDRITQALHKEVAASRCPFVLNIASQEYAKAVDLSSLGAPVITAHFPGCRLHTSPGALHA